MSLSTLPDLCLLTILDRIPLYDLLATVNRVCHRWASLRPIACRRRHSLILIDRLFNQANLINNLDILCDVTNENGIYLYPIPISRPQIDTLLMSKLNPQLVTLLPNITSLKFGQRFHPHFWTNQIDQINQLLHGWSVKLVHLSLWLSNKSTIPRIGSTRIEQSIESLINQMANLPTLKWLEFQIQISKYGGNFNLASSTKLQQILSQLEQLHFGQSHHQQFNNYIMENIEHALKQPNCALKEVLLKRRINFDFSNLTNPNLRELWRVCSRLTELESVVGQKASLHLSIFPLFPNLKYLTLNITTNTVSFGMIIDSLSHLTQLTLLKLDYVPLSFFQTRTSPELPNPIPSLKALDFERLPVISHEDMENLAISVVFPNVQIIRLSQLNSLCLECGYNFHNVSAELQDNILLEKCFRLKCKSLNKCTKLISVSFDRNFYDNRTIKHVITHDQLGQ